MPYYYFPGNRNVIRVYDGAIPAGTGPWRDFSLATEEIWVPQYTHDFMNTRLANAGAMWQTLGFREALNNGWVFKTQPTLFGPIYWPAWNDLHFYRPARPTLIISRFKIDPNNILYLKNIKEFTYDDLPFEILNDASFCNFRQFIRATFAHCLLHKFLTIDIVSAFRNGWVTDR